VVLVALMVLVVLVALVAPVAGGASGVGGWRYGASRRRYGAGGLEICRTLAIFLIRK